jgi:transposase
MSVMLKIARLWSAAGLLFALAKDSWRTHDVAVAGPACQKCRAGDPTHAEGALIEMNVHLHNTISDLSGVSGQAMIRAIVSDQRDPRQLAALRDPRIQASEEEIIHSLQGNWKEDVLFELQQAVEAYDFHRQQMTKCDRQLEQYMAALPTRETVPVTLAPTAPSATTDLRKRSRSSKPKGNQPAFDLAVELERILGVNAQRIDDIDVMTIQTVVAEVGTDLRAWKTEAHWTSWLNLAPKRDISGGRVIRHTREHHTNRVGNAFRIAAQSLVRSASYLGARYRYLRAQLGGLKAVKAMARVLACIFYRLVTKGQLWIDRGAEEFERRRQQRDLASLQRRARSLGMQLVPAA